TECEKCAGQRHSCAGQNTAPNPQSIALAQAVIERASDQATYRHRNERQHGVKRACLQIQLPRLRQVDIEPGEEYPSHVSVAEITERDRQNFFAADYHAPRQQTLASRAAAIRYLEAGFNVGEFGLGDTRMIGWSVPCQQIP